MPVDPGVGVNRFEDLRVRQAARQQSDRVGELLKRPPLQRDLKLSDQMNDAALSVMFNITEGFLRRRDGETAQFLLGDQRRKQRRRITGTKDQGLSEHDDVG